MKKHHKTDFHTSGESPTGLPHGSLSPKHVAPAGPELNQIAPATHFVGTQPEDAGQYDENFGHAASEE